MAEIKISPMLVATAKGENFREGLIYEPKMDGARAICYIDHGIRLISRQGNDVTKKYPEFNWRKNIDALTCILDGEIVVCDKKGRPKFILWQYRGGMTNPREIEHASKNCPAAYVVFDILMKNGELLTEVPLEQRKQILEETVTNGDCLQKIYSTEDGHTLLKQIVENRLEGMVIKEKKGLYHPGKRSYTWRKVVVNRH